MEQRGKFAPKSTVTTVLLSYLFKNLIALIPEQFHNFSAGAFNFCSLESITWRQCKNMLLNQGNVAKMLPVKSEGACSLTLVPRLAHLISQDNSGKIHNDLASNSPQAISNSFSKDL